MRIRPLSVLLTAILLLPSFITAQNLLNGCEHVVYDTLYNRYLATSFRNGDVIQMDGEGTQDDYYNGPGNTYALEIVGDTVYVTCGVALRGLDRETGEPLWIQSITGCQQLDGIVSDTSGHLFIVDAATNGRIWKINISDRSYSLFVSSGLPTFPQDIAFDKEHGLYSIPARFGLERGLLVARISHIATLLVLIALGMFSGLSWPYWLGMIVIAGLLVYEHSLVSPTDLSKLNLAFFNINGYISITLFVATLAAVLID